jgi:hypothetical protein
VRAVLLGSSLLVAVAAGMLAGCSVDRIEWESSGFPVEEVARDLEDRHGATDPRVECIKREVGGSRWECRATAAEAEFECEVKAGIRESIRSIDCDRADAERGEQDAAAA